MDCTTPRREGCCGLWLAERLLGLGVETATLPAHPQVSALCAHSVGPLSSAAHVKLTTVHIIRTRGYVHRL